MQYSFNNIRQEWKDLLDLQEIDIDNDNKLVIITGDNASGKSLLRKVIIGKARKQGLSQASVSQSQRSQSDFTRPFVYGDDTEDATGQVTIRSINGVFCSVAKWDTDNIGFIDEPEIGLGEEAQAGMGLYIAEQLGHLSPHTIKIFIITHSRIIINSLKHIPHSFINLGGKYKTADEWLNREIVPVDPATVTQRGRDKWSKVDSLMQELSKLPKEK